MAEYGKPLPEINDLNRPFWEAAKNHELRMQRCTDCGQFRYPPAPICSNCLSDKYKWEKLTGRGKVWSWGIFHQLYYPAFASEIPYNVVLIELDEGTMLISNMVGISNEEIMNGMRVEVVFDDVTDQISLPKFKPASEI